MSAIQETPDHSPNRGFQAPQAPKRPGRLIERIETETPCGRRDYAMVLLAVSTVRCCDIVALRLEEIDWRRDEIRGLRRRFYRPAPTPR
jgi:site-specific recombinase XerC